ncbi:MAG: M20/M25/M40 family metallo-hydrolase [Candidatus Omnitrophica bacterium]|nr:M20/M25/M40 family metallo-hydrolase [Candidatus Omnitrophota bacterium]
MYNRLQEQSDRTFEKAIRFTQDLIRCPSPNSDESRAADRIFAEMQSLNFDQTLRDDAGNLVAIVKGGGDSPNLLLVSHIDTAPAPENEDWRQDPYAADIVDRRLYGLGASDCKSGLAAQLYASQVIKNSFLFPLKGNLIIAATTAEKDGLSVGARHLIEKTLPQIGCRPSCAILGEPTNLGLNYGHDGWMRILIQVSKDYSLPVEEASYAIYFHFHSHQKVNANEKQCKEMIVHKPRFSWDKNTYKASIAVDRRLYADENPDGVMRTISDQASRIAQEKGRTAASVEIAGEEVSLIPGEKRYTRWVSHPWSTNPFHPMFDRARQSLADAGCPVQPQKWNFRRMIMGTSGGVLSSYYKIPTLGYGPGSEETAHAADEYVEIDNIRRAIYGTSVLAHGLLCTTSWTKHQVGFDLPPGVRQ